MIKGFIVGLALTIIIGQVPKLFGVEKGDGDFFEQLWDVLDELGDTRRADARSSARCRWRSCSGCGASRRWCRARSSPCCSGIAAVELFDLDEHGVDIVGHIDGGPAAARASRTSALHDVGTLVAGGVAVMLVGFAEGLGAAKTYAAREHYEIDANRELLGLGAANLAAGLSSGMVVNGSLSKTAVNGRRGAQHAALRAGRRRAHGRHAAVPHRPVRAAARGDAGRGRDRGRDRARRHPRAARALPRHRARAGPRYGVAARPDFIAAIAAMLGVLVFDTLPGLFIGIVDVAAAAALPRVAAAHRDARPRAGHARQYGDIAPPPGEPRRPTGVAVLRVEGGLYFANADAVRDACCRPRPRRACTRSCSTPRRSRSSTSPPREMLDELADDLRRDGVRLLVARDVGQVRDVLGRAADDPALQRVYPSVQAAVEAATAAGPEPA